MASPSDAEQGQGTPRESARPCRPVVFATGCAILLLGVLLFGVAKSTTHIENRPAIGSASSGPWAQAEQAQSRLNSGLNEINRERNLSIGAVAVMSFGVALLVVGWRGRFH